MLDLSDEQKTLQSLDDIRKFNEERIEVLTNLEQSKIIPFLTKWGFEPPEDPELFWIGLHIARALCKEVPRDKRGDSAMWLAERGIDLRMYVRRREE